MTSTAFSSDYGWLPGKELYRTEFEQLRRTSPVPGDDREDAVKADVEYGNGRYRTVTDRDDWTGPQGLPEGYEEVAYLPSADDGMAAPVGSRGRVKLLRRKEGGLPSNTVMPDAPMGPSAPAAPAAPSPSWGAARSRASQFLASSTNQGIGLL